MLERLLKIIEELRNHAGQPTEVLVEVSLVQYPDFGSVQDLE